MLSGINHQKRFPEAWVLIMRKGRSGQEIIVTVLPVHHHKMKAEMGKFDGIKARQDFAGQENVKPILCCRNRVLHLDLRQVNRIGMLPGTMDRQPNRCGLRLVMPAADGHKQETMAKPGCPMNILNVSRVEANLDTVAFIGLRGPAPKGLFFFGNDQRKEQA